MKTFFALSLLLSPAAFGGEPALHLEYLRLGTESVEAAEKAGREELEAGNACALPLQRDLKKLAQRPDLQKAGDEAARQLTTAVAGAPHLILRASNGSILLRFELWPEGQAARRGKPLFRKEVVLTDQPATWKARVGRGHCRIPAGQADRLVSLIAEPARLMDCKLRKIELLDRSQKITNFLYEYVPDKWLAESQERLARREVRLPGLLRVDQAVYRKGNDTYASCRRGLELLETEGKASLVLLKDLADHKTELTPPWEAMDRLQRALDSGSLPQ